MEDQRITDYFYPSLNTSFALCMGVQEIESVVLAVCKRNDDVQDADREDAGIADCAKTNQLFKKLFAEASGNLEYLQVGYEEIIKTWRRPSKSKSRNEPRTDSTTSEEAEVAFLRFYVGQSIPTIADKLWITEIKVKTIWNKFTNNLKIRRKANQKYLNKKKRLDERHHECIKDYLNKNMLSMFTLQDLRAVLISKFPELVKLSMSTISKSLRTQYNMSYRKVSKAAPKTLTNDSRGRTMETIVIMNHFGQQNIEVVFIDEFTVSGRSYKPYSWSKVNQNGLKKIQASSFSMGFIIGLSHRCVCEIIGIKGTTTQSIFAFYLSKLLQHLKSNRTDEYPRFVLWCDNASYHKTDLITKLLK